MDWIRQPQEQEGQDYWFDGRCYMTALVRDSVSEEELLSIVADLQQYAQEQQGIDHLQSYVHRKTGEKLWVMDRVTRSSLRSGAHTQEQNYFTILYPAEY